MSDHKHGIGCHSNMMGGQMMKRLEVIVACSMIGMTI